MVGGAWPFLVGGVICLVDSDNERDEVTLLVCCESHDLPNFPSRQTLSKSRKHLAITGELNYDLIYDGE